MKAFNIILALGFTALCGMAVMRQEWLWAGIYALIAGIDWVILIRENGKSGI